MYLWNGNSLTWTLTSFRLTIDTSDASRICPSYARVELTFYTARKLTEQEINALIASLANAIGISPDRITVRNVTYTPVTLRKRSSSVADLELEIEAADGTQQNEPDAAEAVKTLIETAKNDTAMNEIIDPSGTGDLQFLGLKSGPTGIEQSGSAIPDRSAGPRAVVTNHASGRKTMDLIVVWCCFVLVLIQVALNV